MLLLLLILLFVLGVIFLFVGINDEDEEMTELGILIMLPLLVGLLMDLFY